MKFKFSRGYLLCLLSIFFLSHNAKAFVQHEKLWLGINSQQTLSEDKKWLSFVFSQFRFINESHPWQSTLFESGIGYQIMADKSIWLGYRWSGINPYNKFYQENRLFQQFIGLIDGGKSKKIISRSRLEELQRTNQNQIAVRFRERLAMELQQSVFSKGIYPFMYNELFFQLNKTDYTANSFISENRLFIGFNLYTSKTAWWEIGYINQLQIHTPSSPENEMSHILSVTYSFI